MKTITGNEVRFPLAMFGKKIANHAEACAAIPFTIVSEPAARHSTGKAIPNTQNLYRSDNGFCLGQHTPQFTYLQPCDSLRTLEKARQLVGGEWQSVSVTKGGRSLAAFVGLESQIVAPKRGDRVGLSIGYFDSYDGSGKAILPLFANVLACENGMTRAESIMSFSAKHSASLSERFAAMEFKLLVNLQDQIADLTNTVAALDNRAMARDEMTGFARKLFPAKDETDVPTRTENVRAEVIANFTHGRGNVGRTRWDAFNAVTEHLDWQATFRETDFSREENRFDSLTVGNGAKTRARALEMLLN